MKICVALHFKLVLEFSLISKCFYVCLAYTPSSEKNIPDIFSCNLTEDY